ncbi:SDR family oxidoreductase [Sphingomonas sp. CGMCC 1.13654]|uniref:SDR family oxidoreductase n=1 Tax=Sphingomonas chungangi TaxID=2683589 RepID=A0A838L697_9SPHN|nr:SDR family oxidoreductase [Sphingomonas chungangi]MBA2934567.1 SDR family oxidoreductase [Sphingomonas chungangi]MVW57603.1 SDR family oxidoreductase [Sphingomonas chungangi]
MGILVGKVAFVTGGSSGIGLATAALFAKEGAHVVISGRRRDMLDAAVLDIGAGTVGLDGDVADIAFHMRAADEIAARFGGLDIYVANAGTNTIRQSSEVSVEEYDAQFAINTRGVFFGVQAIAPIMRDGGSIVVTGSLASEKVLEGHAVYAGTKAAIGAFARSWALELKARRIRVNMLSPGPTDTAILDKLGVPAAERESFMGSMAAAIPLGRFAEADEMARAALFLASDAGSFVTGVNLRVDGGMALA